MYYCVNNNHVWTGKSIPELLHQLPYCPPFNERYLSKYLLHGFFSSRSNLFETIFQDVYRVPMGYQLTRDPWGRPHIERAWSLKDQRESAVLSFSDAVAIFRDKLKNAVAQRLPSNKSVAIELSGGLDSSSVAAMTRCLLPHHPIIALSNGVPHSRPAFFSKLSADDKKHFSLTAYDESKWSRHVADELQITHCVISDGYHFHDLLEQYTGVLGSFTEVLFPILNHRIYEHCESRGIGTLLSGFGGDEVVSQHATLHLLELRERGAFFTYFYEKLRSKKARDWLVTFHLLHKSSSLWKKPLEHLPYLRLPEICHHIDLPHHVSVQSREYEFIEGDLSLHWQRRIETSQIIARHHNIDYQFPLTDPKLMQFFHHLPSDYKYRHGKGRYLMRCSMEGLLSSRVVWRDDKAGATAPAAWSNLIAALPELFLSRITANHQGLLADYVDIPKLVKRIESGPVLNSTLMRLVMATLTFAHLETVVKKWKRIKV